MNNDQESRITRHPAVIVNYLKEICQLKTPLLIKLLDSDLEYIFESSILKVQPESQAFILGSFLPPELRSKGHFPCPVEVKCQLTHGSLTFISQLWPMEKSDLLSHYQLAIPGEMVKDQQRSSYRVSLLQYDAEVKLTVDDDITLEGICNDFSTGGSLCQVRGSSKNTAFHKKQILEDCNITIPGLLNFSCAAEISHVKTLPNKQVQMGLKFIDISSALSNQIAKTISRLERDSIRMKVNSRLAS